MPTATIEVFSSLSGRHAMVQRTADGRDERAPTLAAGLVPTTWTKTDANTGTAVLPEGHGLVTSDVVAVLWAGGFRYGLTATVTGNSAVLDGGAGDDLPANGTPVVVAKKVVVDLVEAGNDIALLEISGRKSDNVTAARVLAVFVTSENVAIAAFDVTDFCLWAVNLGLANPLAGAAIAAIWIFNGADASNTVCIEILSDTTP